MYMYIQLVNLLFAKEQNVNIYVGFLVEYDPLFSIFLWTLLVLYVSLMI